MRFLVGGFHDQLQVVTYRDGHLGLSVLESDDLPKCNAMTWITAAFDANHFYGLQALPDEDGRVHFFRLDGGRVHVLDSLFTLGRDPCHCCLGDGALMITNVCLLSSQDNLSNVATVHLRKCRPRPASGRRLLRSVMRDKYPVSRLGACSRPARSCPPPRCPL
jgi:hypothetical protein